MEDSLRLERAVGDRRSLGYGLINLVDLLGREGHVDDARTALERPPKSLLASTTIGWVHSSHTTLATSPPRAGQTAQAAIHYYTVDGFSRVGDQRDVALASWPWSRTGCRTVTSPNICVSQPAQWHAAWPTWTRNLGVTNRVGATRYALAHGQSKPPTQ